MKDYVIHPIHAIHCSGVYEQSYGLLICILISENQGLEKSRTVSKFWKISGPADLEFFKVSTYNKPRFVL